MVPDRRDWFESTLLPHEELTPVASRQVDCAAEKTLKGTVGVKFRHRLETGCTQGIRSAIRPAFVATGPFDSSACFFSPVHQVEPRDDPAQEGEWSSVLWRADREGTFVM